MQQYTGKDGEPVFQGLKITKSAVAVELSQRRWGESTTQSFLSLPGVESVDHLDATIRIPETGTEHLQVALDKNLRPLCSMLDEPDRHFPALIVKDQRAIPKGQKRQTECRDGQVSEIEGRDGPGSESEVPLHRRPKYRRMEGPQ